jgi:hypothetical protein
MRDLVTSSRDYYVAVNGDEGNTGLSSGSPWPIRYAIDHVARNLDIQHARVTIHAAEPGSGQCYPTIVLPNWFGNAGIDPGEVVNGIPGGCYTAPCIIGGDFDSLSAYRIGSPIGQTQQPFAILAIENHLPWFVSGFYPANVHQAVLADKHGKIDLGHMLHGESNVHMEAINGGFIETLRGSKTRFYGPAQRHASAQGAGSIVIAQSASDLAPAAYYECVDTNPGSGSWPTFSHCFAYACGPATVDMRAASAWGWAYGTRKIEQQGGQVMMQSPTPAPWGMT